MGNIGSCGSLRESDLEEELFGQSRDCSRQGTGPLARVLEASQCGTLFLDGVAQLPLWAQIKLLDALQCSSGRNQENGAVIPPQARVIASSMCDLQTAVVEKPDHFGHWQQGGARRQQGRGEVCQRPRPATILRHPLVVTRQARDAATLDAAQVDRDNLEILRRPERRQRSGRALEGPFGFR